MMVSKVKKSKHKIIIIAISIALLEFTGILPYAVARTTSSIYVSRNYPEDDLKFDSIEYAPPFGEYSVKYKCKKGADLGLMIYPKPFPIIITYDSIKGQG